MQRRIRSFPTWPSYSKEEISAVSNVLKSNQVNYWTGAQCRDFEKEFCTWTGSKHSIALSNGTVALDLALRALDLAVTVLFSIEKAISANAFPLASPNASAAAVVIAVPFVKVPAEGESFRAPGLLFGVPE